MSDPVTKDSAAQAVLDRVVGEIQELGSGTPTVPQRPDIAALQEAINKFQLSRSPADATAYHDFNVVQVAFKHVWMQAFDESLRALAEELYNETAKLYDDAGLTVPPVDAITDVRQLQDFMSEVGATLGGDTNIEFPSATASNAFPDINPLWPTLTREQQILIENQAVLWANGDTDQKQQAVKVVQIISSTPQGPGARLASLLLNLDKALSEPYAFDVFAPNSYNFGIMVTYRQQWEPLDYQAGNLIATLPLAPGETRKFSKKKTVKASRAQKEAEKSVSSTSRQSSELGRAEAEIMTKTVTDTNFKMTAHGSFNVGVGSIDATTEFGLNQNQQSATTKKDFHEATLRAAEEYRLERSIDVDTTTTTESESTSSGEISNPNNELTVTYLFYELQRRYQINETIHRARAVILVAQDVPAPHEIDEAWLITHQWIISRVLLDDSFRSALIYLTSGFAGDQISLEVVKAHWEDQKQLSVSLEAQVNAQMASRDYLREAMVQTSLAESVAESVKGQDVARAIGDELDPKKNTFAALTGGVSLLFGGSQERDLAKISKDTATIDTYEANRKATQTRLQYVEDALTDAQNKLSQARDAYQKATDQYSAALQQQYNRKVAIDQLRIHVKQNIFYYMQAIWDCEPPDQRFFRLYNKKVTWTEPIQGCWLEAINAKDRQLDDRLREIAAISIGDPNQVQAKMMIPAGFRMQCGPMIGQEERELVEVADLDNPVGYKGNYMIFPLRESCYLTTYMLAEFVDEYFGVRDPDQLGNYSIEDLTQFVAAKLQDPNVSDQDKKTLRDYFIQRLTEDKPASDKIIVPTGQLFIEALPGSHVLLEDFKLLHRIEDVRKVHAEVRHAEMENLRLAARLIAGEREDPDIEKRILVDKGVPVVSDS